MEKLVVLAVIVVFESTNLYVHDVQIGVKLGVNFFDFYGFSFISDGTINRLPTSRDYAEIPLNQKESVRPESVDAPHVFWYG